MHWRPILLIAVVLLVVAGIGVAAWTQRHRWQQPDTPEDPEHAAHGPVELQSVKLSEEAFRALKLQCEPVRLEEYPRVLEVPGIITDAPGCTRAISTPVTGIVTKVHAVPGEAIRPGTLLFTLQLASEFVQTTQTEWARGAKDLVAAIARRDQTKKLVMAGTKPGIELTEDENQVRRLTTQAEGHRRQLRLFGLNEAQVKQAEAGDFVTELAITAPSIPHHHTTDGPFFYEVEAIAVAPGQGVTGGQLLARVADHYELMIEGQAFETEAGLVTDATGTGRVIGVDFLEPAAKNRASEMKLVIRSVGKTDPATRTFPFFALLANEAKPYERDGKTYQSWRYRAGQQVRVRIPTSTIPNVIILPADAVVREGPDAYVFRQNDESFDRKAVVIVAEDRLNVAIAPGNGIEAGTSVLRNNAAAVNRALKAAQARGFGGTGGKKGHWHADGTFHEEKD